MELFVSGTHIYHNAKCYADWRHCRRDNCNRTHTHTQIDRITANLISNKTHSVAFVDNNKSKLIQLYRKAPSKSGSGSRNIEAGVVLVVEHAGVSLCQPAGLSLFAVLMTRQVSSPPSLYFRIAESNVGLPCLEKDRQFFGHNFGKFKINV